jgi:hypothetical protein
MAHDNDEILYIAGTNYLEKFKFKNNSSYGFSRNMFPCGWASWNTKFLKFYDGSMIHFNAQSQKNIKESYKNKVFYKYDLTRFNSEFKRKLNNENFVSWDYQLAFSLRYFKKYCIVPSFNQILNIGVDDISIHGGSTSELIMTKRLTGMKSHPIIFPLNHPININENVKFEKKIEHLLTPPSRYLINNILIKTIRFLFRIPSKKPLITGLKDIFKL